MEGEGDVRDECEEGKKGSRRNEGERKGKMKGEKEKEGWMDRGIKEGREVRRQLKQSTGTLDSPDCISSLHHTHMRA